VILKGFQNVPHYPMFHNENSTKSQNVKSSLFSRVMYLYKYVNIAVYKLVSELIFMTVSVCGLYK